MLPSFEGLVRSSCGDCVPDEFDDRDEKSGDVDAEVETERGGLVVFSMGSGNGSGNGRCGAGAVLLGNGAMDCREPNEARRDAINSDGVMVEGSGTFCSDGAGAGAAADAIARGGMHPSLLLRPKPPESGTTDAACDAMDDEAAEVGTPPPNAESIRRLRSNRFGCACIMARNMGAEAISLLPRPLPQRPTAAAIPPTVVLTPTVWPAPLLPAVRPLSARGAARGAKVLRSCAFRSGTPGVDGNDENDESDSGLSTASGLFTVAC